MLLISLPFFKVPHVKMMHFYPWMIFNFLISIVNQMQPILLIDVALGNNHSDDVDSVDVCDQEFQSATTDLSVS